MLFDLKPFHLGHYGLFLAGKDQQQTNQPNDQSDGNPNL